MPIINILEKKGKTSITASKKLNKTHKHLSNTTNYISLNLTKEGKRFYNKNCTKVMKETEKDIRKWKDLPYS